MNELETLRRERDRLLLENETAAGVIKCADAALRGLLGSHDRQQQALADCYMIARRETARLNREARPDQKSLEAMAHVIRFCESTGQKSQILRDSVPTEIQSG